MQLQVLFCISLCSIETVLSGLSQVPQILLKKFDQLVSIILFIVMLPEFVLAHLEILLLGISKMATRCFMKKLYFTKENNILQSCNVAVKHDFFLKINLASESLSRAILYRPILPRLLEFLKETSQIPSFTPKTFLQSL